MRRDRLRPLIAELCGTGLPAWSRSATSPGRSLARRARYRTRPHGSWPICAAAACSSSRRALARCRACELALELDHPVYDCLYVAALDAFARRVPDRRPAASCEAGAEPVRAGCLSPVRCRSTARRLSCATVIEAGVAPCPPTPSCRSPPTSASCAAPRIPRSWSCRRRRWVSPGIAVTDRNSLAGIVRAHQQAKELGVRFLVGCRLDLVDGTSLLCWPTDKPAYARLSSLLDPRQAAGGQGRLHADAGRRAGP